MLVICDLGGEIKGLTAHVGIAVMSSWAETAVIAMARTVAKVADFIIARN